MARNVGGWHCFMSWPRCWPRACTITAGRMNRPSRITIPSLRRSLSARGGSPVTRPEPHRGSLPCLPVPCRTSFRCAGRSLPGTTERLGRGHHRSCPGPVQDAPPDLLPRPTARLSPPLDVVGLFRNVTSRPDLSRSHPSGGPLRRGPIVPRGDGLAPRGSEIPPCDHPYESEFARASR